MVACSNHAVATVANELGNNGLDIEPSDLTAMQNPKGTGILVYVPETRFSGVERNIVWLVLEDSVYPLNGATKGVTPSLPWPREASADLWEETGLDQYRATEVIDIIWGDS